MKFKRDVAAAILRDLLTKNTMIEDVSDISHEEFVFHAGMLSDAGIIEAALLPDFSNFQAQRITWFGYSRLYEFDEALGKEFDPKNFVRNFQRG